MREKQKARLPASGYWTRPKTAMGARLLRSYVEQPLIEKAEIEKRQDAIADINHTSDHQRGTAGVLKSDLRSWNVSSPASPT